MKITRRKLRRIIQEELNREILSEQVAHVPATVATLRSIMGPGTGNSPPRGSHKADSIMKAWTQILIWFKRYGDSETRRESVRKVCTRLIAPAPGGQIQRQSGAGYIDHQGLDPTESCTDDRRDRSEGDGPGIEWDDCLPCEQSTGVADGLGPITNLFEEEAVLKKVFRYVACAAGIEFIRDRHDDLSPMITEFSTMLREYRSAIQKKFPDPENR